MLPFELSFLLIVLVVSGGSVSSSEATHNRGTVLSFNVAQKHSTTPDGEVTFKAISELTVATYALKARPTLISRPVSQAQFQRARRKSRHSGVLHNIPWRVEEVLGPDITDGETLKMLARIAGNAYSKSGDKNWYDLDDRWDNNTMPIGWEPDDDGFRGNVFTSSDNSTVVLSIKGTSPIGPTSAKDKLNDNLLFSCCCARVGPSWKFNTVCDCYSGNSRCDQKCLEEAVAEESLFYSSGVNLYNNLTSLYPDANIWIVGHSLGGGLAALLGATFGVPTVSFESPGERIASERLHLPLPPTDFQGITHVYHNADPVPQGSCTGFLSWCSRGGFALETQCHLGKSIVYDTVSMLGWRVDLRYHTIRTVIEQVLDQDWEVPKAVAETDCFDCYKWDFGDYKLSSGDELLEQRRTCGVT